MVGLFSKNDSLKPVSHHPDHKKGNAMAGQIKAIIDTIVAQRANGNPTIIATTKAKILLKGIDPEQYNANSEDNPAVLAKARKIAEEFNIHLAA
jgi:hypothetical protein